MKLTAVVACGCAAIGTQARATTYVVPHILEVSGSITAGGSTSPLHSPLSTDATLDVFGPDGDTGAFTYSYAGTIRWNGTDFQGRAFTMDFDVQFCQNRPEGNGYRFEMIADPILVSFQGFVLNSHAGGLDLSVFGFDPEPIGSAAGVTLDVPPMHFDAIDGDGRNMTMDTDEGTLRLIPAPMSTALLALAGLFKMRRRR
jgi:hypothetical protein